MKCSVCGAENPEGANFCQRCGNRMGAIICPVCGKSTPSDGKYCTNCGAPLQGILKDGESAVQSDGYAAAAVEQVPPAEGGEGNSSDRALKRSRICGTVSYVLAALGALISLIFVFLIGFNTRVSSGGESALADGSLDIYYFFGDAYNAFDGAPSPASTTYTAYAVIGTVLCALGMLATVACFIVCVVNAVKKLRGKEADLFRPALFAMLSYIFSVALFSVCASERSDIAGVTMETCLNGATVAGIVLCVVFIVCASAFRIAEKRPAGTARSFAVNGCAAAVFIVLSCLLLWLISEYAFCISLEYSSYNVDYANGISSALAFIGTSSLYGGADVIDVEVMCAAETAMLSVMALSAVSVCVLFALSFADMLRGAGQKVGGRTVGCLIAAGACGILCGLMNLASSAVFVAWRGTSSMLATAGVFTVILGIFLIVAVALYKKFGAKPER